MNLKHFAEAFTTKRQDAEVFIDSKLPEMTQALDMNIAKLGDQIIQQRQQIQKQMEELQKTLDMVEYKCWYYDTACEEGTEKNLRHDFETRMPDLIRDCYRNAHR